MSRYCDQCASHDVDHHPYEGYEYRCNQCGFTNDAEEDQILVEGDSHDYFVDYKWLGGTTFQMWWFAQPMSPLAVSIKRTEDLSIEAHNLLEDLGIINPEPCRRCGHGTEVVGELTRCRKCGWDSSYTLPEPVPSTRNMYNGGDTLASYVLTHEGHMPVAYLYVVESIYDMLDLVMSVVSKPSRVREGVRVYVDWLCGLMHAADCARMLQEIVNQDTRDRRAMA